MQISTDMERLAGLPADDVDAAVALVRSMLEKGTYRLWMGEVIYMRFSGESRRRLHEALRSVFAQYPPPPAFPDR